MINSKIVCTLLFEVTIGIENTTRYVNISNVPTQQLCHISMEERDELILLNSVTMMVELSNNKGLH